MCGGESKTSREGQWPEDFYRVRKTEAAQGVGPANRSQSWPQLAVLPLAKPAGELWAGIHIHYSA